MDILYCSQNIVFDHLLRIIYNNPNTSVRCTPGSGAVLYAPNPLCPKSSILSYKELKNHSINFMHQAGLPSLITFHGMCVRPQKLRV